MKKIALALLITIFFSFPSQSKAQETLKLGILFPFSGPLAMVGNDYWESWDIVSNMINQKGGVLGKKVVGVKADAVDPKAAMAEAERLITAEHVNIIVGTYSSPRAVVASEVAERYKKIYYEIGAAADTLTERDMKYFFRLQVKGSDYGKMGATFISKVWAPAAKMKPQDLKVVVCYEDSVWGSTINKAFLDQAEKEGFKIADSTAYNYKSVDFSAMITKFKSIQPDIVFGANYPNDFMIMWRQMKQLKLNMKGYIGTGTLIHESLAEALGNDIDYVFDVQGVGLQNFNLDYISPKTRAFLKDAKEHYQEKYKKEMPPIIYGNAYMMWLLLDTVLPMAGSDDPEAVRKALLSLDISKKDTLLGYGIKFDPKSGQDVRAVPGVMQWQNKKLWTVYPHELATSKMWVEMPTWDERAKK